MLHRQIPCWLQPLLSFCDVRRLLYLSSPWPFLLARSEPTPAPVHLSLMTLIAYKSITLMLASILCTLSYPLLRLSPLPFLAGPCHLSQPCPRSTDPGLILAPTDAVQLDTDIFSPSPCDASPPATLSSFQSELVITALTNSENRKFL